MYEATDTRKLHKWRWRLCAVIVLVAAITALIAGVRYWSWHDEHVRTTCIAALQKAGADVQFGVASERYYVYVNARTFDDKQLAAILPYLKELGPLESLSLCHTEVSDRSVNLLSQCNVRALHVSGTQISAKGAADLQRRLPHTWITHQSLRAR